MIEVKDNCYKGTRIIIGNEKRDYLNRCQRTLRSAGYDEISIPIINLSSLFENKVGPENNNMMYKLTDAGNRDLCLAPEYTAIIQGLSKTTFKHKKDVKLFYIQECFRGEKPQSGRYRQFTQLGVEIINPSKDHDLSLLAMTLLSPFGVTRFKLNEGVTRGLDYYTGGKGFEITCDELGSSKQVCGGGSYEGGIGFALGIDRIILLNKENGTE